MGYSVQVSYRQAPCQRSEDQIFKSAVDQYNNAPDKGKARRSLLERFGGAGTMQIIKAATANVAPVEEIVTLEKENGARILIPVRL